MTSDNFENLVRTRQLKKEPPRDDELAGLKQSGLSRLAAAERPGLSFESRFDLAYNGAQALALYALRRLGYRPEKRYLVFQVLPETTGLAIAHSWSCQRRTQSAISASTKVTLTRMSVC